MNKWTYRAILIAAFSFQYVIPIVLFGGIIPYFRSDLKRGLTAVGYIALAIVLLILMGKIQKYIDKWDDSASKEVILSAFPIAKWIFGGITLSIITELLLNVFDWWWQVLIFIVIGRMLYIFAAHVKEELEEEKKAKKEGEDK